MSAKDYKFSEEIGEGSFSRVYVVKQLSNDKIFAMKVVEKAHVLSHKAVDAVLMEKEVLKVTSSPFIVQLVQTFHDDKRLYYVLEYAERGELLQYLQKLTNITVPCARFYAAEIFCAINYLHSKHIIHRDLKPENVLLDQKMHVKLADFGSAIILSNPNIKAPNFTGTPQYVSPEMINGIHGKLQGDNLDYNQSSSLIYMMDYWAFACVLYQMLSGKTPFRFASKDESEYLIFRKILSLEYEFVDGFDDDARDLIQKILVISPAERLGSISNGGPEAIRSHQFFKGTDWENIHNIDPPELMSNLEPIKDKDWESVPIGFEAGQLYHLSAEFGMIATSVTESERESLLKEQYLKNPFHRFVKNRLIVRQGILFKRKGLFARKRMFLLTEGPHLFYVDSDAMLLKGEIPWSTSMSVEFRNTKLFYIHVPNRTYFLEDPSGDSKEWIKMIKKMYHKYYERDVELICKDPKPDDL